MSATRMLSGALILMNTQLMLVLLKLDGVFPWGWFIVFVPMWLPTAVGALALLKIASRYDENGR
jgi:hypothetical protein